jgi:hypothetical protein
MAAKKVHYPAVIDKDATAALFLPLLAAAIRH